AKLFSGNFHEKLKIQQVRDFPKNKLSENAVRRSITSGSLLSAVNEGTRINTDKHGFHYKNPCASVFIRVLETAAKLFSGNFHDPPVTTNDETGISPPFLKGAGGIFIRDFHINSLIKITICLLLMTAFSFTWTARAAGPDTTLELRFGYDDNVPLSPDTRSSAFANYRMKLARQFFADAPSMDGNIFIEGTYRDYFSLEDNYQFRTEAEFSLSLVNGSVIPGIISEARVSRDDFLPEDDRDEFMIGVQLDWLMTGRLTLGAWHMRNWSDYRYPVIIPGEPDAPGTGPGQDGNGGFGQHGGMGPGQGQPGWGNITEPREISRDDRLHFTGLHGTFFFTSELQATLSAEYTRLTSSAEPESYRQKGLGISLLWIPDDVWEISGMMYRRRSEYDYSPDDIDRADTIDTVSLEIRRFFKHIELFLELERTENDSPLDEEDYRQAVTQCGFTWPF
ncbi:hypothetical protein QUF80_01790, partial [Desulfococcaceae bacterium HSG8]|nr:hypothetical protein [Desulfococcaceae bacterium HSG8]